MRVAFTKIHAISGESEKESVSQFFHILGSVDQQRGCCEVADGKYEITLYTSCCNVTKGIEEMPGYEEISEELLHSARVVIEADNEMQRIKDKIGMFHEI